MGNAGNVEPQPIVAIDIEGRAVAARPAGEREEAVAILVRLGGRGEKPRAHGARIGEPQAGVEAGVQAASVEGGEHEAPLLAADEGEGPVSRPGPGLALPSSRSIGRCGSQTDTIGAMTKLHDPAPLRSDAPAAFKGETPRGRTWSGRIEQGAAACRCFHPPAAQRAGKRAGAMAGEEQAGGAAGLRGKPETPRQERRLDLDLAEGGGEGLGLQSLLQGPGGVDSVPRLDDEERARDRGRRRADPAHKARPIRAPSLGQAPQQRRGASLSPRHMIAEAARAKASAAG